MSFYPNVVGEQFVNITLMLIKYVSLSPYMPSVLADFGSEPMISVCSVNVSTFSLDIPFPNIKEGMNIFVVLPTI